MSFHGVSLSGTAQARIEAGAPEVPLSDLPDAGGMEPGRPIRLLDRKGETAAIAIADPDNGVLRILARHGLRALDETFFAGRVAAACNLRQAAGLVATSGLTTGEESFRLVNGEGDGLPGFSVDIYGAFAVVCVPARSLLPYGRLLAGAVRQVGETRLGLRGVVLKVRSKDPQDRSSKDEVVGERPPEKLIAHELGAPYELHLLGALNVGLFTDMREHRRGLPRFVAGRTVLNTFSYTGALSVAAARAGASAVTSVDLSSGVLSWAKENFRLSGLPVGDGRHRFEVSDVRRFLEKEEARGAKYDTILFDPPTVSAARASQWSMKKDYPDLIALGAKLLPEAGGILWVATNTRRGQGVLHHVAEGLKRAGRHGAVMELGGLPPDYPTPPAWPEARYLEVCQVYVTG